MAMVTSFTRKLPTSEGASNVDLGMDCAQSYGVFAVYGTV